MQSAVQELLPQIDVGSPADLEQVGIRCYRGKQSEKSLVCNLFAPVQACAAGQTQSVWILSGELPYETQAR